MKSLLMKKSQEQLEIMSNDTRKENINSDEYCL